MYSRSIVHIQRFQLALGRDGLAVAVLDEGHGEGGQDHEHRGVGEQGGHAHLVHEGAGEVGGEGLGGHAGGIVEARVLAHVPAPGKLHHHGAGDGFHPGVPSHLDEPGRVLRAGHGAAEAQHAEAVVDALIEDAAQHRVPLQQEHPVHAFFLGPDRCGQPRGAAADDHKISSFHGHA